MSNIKGASIPTLTPLPLTPGHSQHPLTSLLRLQASGAKSLGNCWLSQLPLNPSDRHIGLKTSLLPKNNIPKASKPTNQQALPKLCPLFSSMRSTYNHPGPLNILLLQLTVKAQPSLPAVHTGPSQPECSLKSWADRPGT